MSKITVYQCDSCNSLLNNVKDGFVIKGNIYVADGQGGLIGNAFPETQSGNIPIDQIKEFSYCTKCFCNALGINFTLVR